MNALAVTAMQIAGAPWVVRHETPGRPTAKDRLTRAQIIAVMPTKGWIKERDICRLLGLDIDRANLDRIRVITTQAAKMGVMERKAADRYARSQPTVRLV